MASLNSVQLIGHITRDPEVRTFPDGNTAASATVATNLVYLKPDGVKVEEAEFHRVEFRNKLATVAGQWLVKGTKVFVQGRLRTRKWTDDEKRDHYVTEIIAQKLLMLGGARAAEGQPAVETPAEEDDIPF